MKIKNADGETDYRESVESARFFPPSSLRPAASALPNPAPPTKREWGSGVGKMEGGKKKEEVVESNLEVSLENGFEEGIGEEKKKRVGEIIFKRTEEVSEVLKEKENGLKERIEKKREEKVREEGRDFFKGTGEVGEDLKEKGRGFEQKTETENNGQRRRKLKDLDIKILGILEVWGALGLGQIEGVCGEEWREAEKVQALFFNESFKYEGRIYLRLRGLERDGLVQTQRALNSKQVYRLTPWGHAALRRQMAAKLPSAPRSVSPTTLEHRIICAGVGLVIARFLTLPVLSERQFYYVLRSNLGKRPEGFHLPDLMVQLPEGRCPVEIELHLKTDESYEALWSFYRDGLGQKDRLIYLTPSRHFTRKLLELARSHEADFLYACDLAAFRGGLGRVEFRNFQGDVFHF